jgi:hypothetical protein
MSKTWPLLVFVSLKYYAEKRLLKTHVAFFMKVTIYTVCRLRSRSRLCISSHKSNTYTCGIQYYYWPCIKNIRALQNPMLLLYCSLYNIYLYTVTYFQTISTFIISSHSKLHISIFFVVVFFSFFAQSIHDCAIFLRFLVKSFAITQHKHSDT